MTAMIKAASDYNNQTVDLLLLKVVHHLVDCYLADFQMILTMSKKTWYQGFIFRATASSKILNAYLVFMMF